MRPGGIALCKWNIPIFGGHHKHKRSNLTCFVGIDDGAQINERPTDQQWWMKSSQRKIEEKKIWKMPKLIKRNIFFEINGRLWTRTSHKWLSCARVSPNRWIRTKFRGYTWQLCNFTEPKTEKSKNRKKKRKLRRRRRRKVKPSKWWTDWENHSFLDARTPPKSL